MRIIYFLSMLIVLTSAACSKYNRKDGITKIEEAITFNQIQSKIYEELGYLEPSDKLADLYKNGLIAFKPYDTLYRVLINGEILKSFREKKDILAKTLNNDNVCFSIKGSYNLVFSNLSNKKALVVYLWKFNNLDSTKIYKYKDWYIFKLDEYEQTLTKENFLIFDSREYRIKSFGLIKKYSFQSQDSSIINTNSKLVFDTINHNLYLNVETIFKYDVTPIDTISIYGDIPALKKKRETKYKFKEISEKLLFDLEKANFTSVSENYRNEIIHFLGITPQNYTKMLEQSLSDYWEY